MCLNCMLKKKKNVRKVPLIAKPTPISVLFLLARVLLLNSYLCPLVIAINTTNALSCKSLWLERGCQKHKRKCK